MDTETMIGRPAGWFRDPAPRNPDAPDTWRYWDGIAWTAQTRTGSKRQRREWREQVVAERREHLRELYTRAEYGDEDARWQLVAMRGPGPTRGPRSTGRWARYGAHLVDSLVVGLVSTVVSLPFLERVVSELVRYLDAVTRASQHGHVPPDPQVFVDRVAGPYLAILAISLLVTLVYEVGFVMTRSATPGKMLLGLQVRPAGLEAPVPWHAALRRWAGKQGFTVLYLLPLGFLLAGVWVLVDYLWALVDPRQSLHDKLAQTQVVPRP